MPEVPGGAAVDVVVALAFLLFVLSVVCAAVVEIIASARNWRGRMLRQAIERLHGGDGAAAIYASHRVAILHGPADRLPSYLPTWVYENAAREVGEPADARSTNSTCRSAARFPIVPTTSWVGAGRALAGWLRRSRSRSARRPVRRLVEGLAPADDRKS
jgi:hypothetical protein